MRTHFPRAVRQVRAPARFPLRISNSKKGFKERIKQMEKEVTEAAAAVAKNGQTVTGAAKCPVAHGARGRRNREWWPDALDISALHRNSTLSDPMGDGFDYAKAFQSLDLDAVIKDLN